MPPYQPRKIGNWNDQQKCLHKINKIIALKQTFNNGEIIPK